MSSKKNTKKTVKTYGAEWDYKVKIAAVRDLLKDIGTALDKHEQKQANSPTDYGHVGSLGYVHAELKDIATFLGVEV